LQPLEVPSITWGTRSTNFFSDLLKTVDGYDAISGVVDNKSKRAHFIPTTSVSSAQPTAQTVFENEIRYSLIQSGKLIVSLLASSLTETPN
jgi:hypothetical protein